MVEQLTVASAPVSIPLMLSGCPVRWIRKVGEGGCGEAWLVEIASDRLLCKLVRRDGDAVQLRQRLENEAAILELLACEGVPAFRGSVRDGDVPALFMEYVDGVSWRQAASSGDDLLSLLRSCAEVLARVHAQGVIHGDVKPENLLVGRGDAGVQRTWLIDFGLARRIDDPRTRITMAGQTLGTYRYLDPRLIDRGDERDQAGDIFSMGKVFEECRAVPRASDRCDAFNALLREMTSPDPAARPAAADVCMRIDAIARTSRRPWRAGSACISLCAAAVLGTLVAVFASSRSRPSSAIEPAPTPALPAETPKPAAPISLAIEGTKMRILSESRRVLCETDLAQCDACTAPDMPPALSIRRVPMDPQAFSEVASTIDPGRKMLKPAKPVDAYLYGADRAHLLDISAGCLILSRDGRTIVVRTRSALRTSMEGKDVLRPFAPYADRLSASAPDLMLLLKSAGIKRTPK